MANAKMKCQRGHSFTAYAASKYSKVECPECKRRAESSKSAMVESVAVSDFWSSSSDSSYSSGSFSSGGGGGGSSGSWD